MKIVTKSRSFNERIIFVILNVFVINFVGLVTIFSTSITPDTDLQLDKIFIRQVIFLVISFLVLYLFSRMEYIYYNQKIIVWAMSILSILSLLLVIFLGVERNGAKRWISLGFMDMQMSEIVKVFHVIIITSLYSFQSSSNLLKNTKILGLGLIYTLLICFLIFIEPDAGMSINIFILWLWITFIGFYKPAIPIIAMFVFIIGFVLGLGIFFNNLILIISLGISLLIIIALLILFTLKKQKVINLFILIIFIVPVIGILLGFFTPKLWESDILEPYQKERILSFIYPTEGNENNWNIVQSIVAVGSGTIIGKGFGHGTQTKLQFLPEYKTDFIFATFAEEFGFIGSSMLIGLFGLLIIQLFVGASQIKDNYGRIIGYAIGMKFLIELIINVGMNLGLTPAKGLPLPFMSAGGSNLFANYLLLGVFCNIIKKDKEIIF